MKETSIVRQNLMDNVNYRPYCGNTIKLVGNTCYNSRTERRPDGQFICPNCKWISSFPDDFVQRYKAKHGL